MTHRWIEVAVRLIGEEYKDNVDVYTQRINYEYFQNKKQNMVAEIAGIVNDIPMRDSIQLTSEDFDELLKSHLKAHQDITSQK